MEVVSDLTGYPVGMIKPDMDIEADLGIDSIKRVEILSTLEERVPDLPNIPPAVVGKMKTLGQVAELLTGSTDAESAEAVPENAEQRLLDAVGDRTGGLARWGLKRSASEFAGDHTHQRAGSCGTQRDCIGPPAAARRR